MAASTPPFICLRCLRASKYPINSTTTRSIATNTTRQRRRSASTTSPPSPYASSSLADTAESLPRWLRTPPRMRMPERLRPLPKGPVWRVNDKQQPVDEMYDRFMGRVGESIQDEVGSARGRDLLPEEIKWLALTHKSFDHGRRGFNDRLAFLGKRIVDLQTTLTLLRMPTPSLNQSPYANHSPPSKDPNVYHHPSLTGLPNITSFSKAAILEKSRLAGIATTYGIDKVVRWKPRKSDDLKSSGEDVVLAHTVYSIVGALALQRGGEVAGRCVRERILGPLGLR